MAKRITLLCDLTGAENAEPVTFTIDDDVYQADFSPDALDKLRRALAPFVKVSQHRVRGGNGNGNGEIAQVRAWAQANGFDVGAKGRIPEDVQAAYNAAQQPATEPQA